MLEEGLPAKLARNLDREDRVEIVASRQREFWARELLLKEMWTRIKWRRDTEMGEGNHPFKT